MGTDWGIRTIIINSDMMIERDKTIVVTTYYDGGDLHIKQIIGRRAEIGSNLVSKHQIQPEYGD